jgi:hypothetical protein
MAAFLVDEFLNAGVSGVDLDAHTPDTGGVGWTRASWDGDTIALAPSSAGYAQGEAESSGFYYHTGTSMADVAVTATFQITDNSSFTVGPLARYTAAGDGSMYWVNYDNGTWSIRNRVTGANSGDLGTYSFTPTNNTEYIVELRCISTTISLWLNNGGVLTQRISFTNSAVTGAGYVGVGGSNKMKYYLLSADAAGGGGSAAVAGRKLLLGVGA